MGGCVWTWTHPGLTCLTATRIRCISFIWWSTRTVKVEHWLSYVDALRHRASRVLGKHRSVRAGTVVVQGDSKICVTLQGKTFHDIRDMSLMNPTRENGCGLFAADSYFPLLVGLFVSGWWKIKHARTSVWLGILRGIIIKWYMTNKDDLRTIER